MNRFTTVNVSGISERTLPPRRYADATRVLFLSTAFLGFRNYYDSMVEACADEPGIDAVHIKLERSRLMKWAGFAVPVVSERGWDQHAFRYQHMWRRVIRRWFHGPLPLEYFDVVHFTTQGNAMAILDFMRSPRPRFAVNLDATAAQSIKTYGRSPIAMAPMIRAENRIFNAADLNVCRNRWCTQSLVEDHCIPESRIHVCRNSMVPSAKHRDQFPPRSPRELVKLIFVGNAFRRKGGPELIQMHQERFRDIAELHICSSQAVQDPTAKNVIWHGAVPREKIIHEMLPQMDIFVLPTRKDMHPWAILEAASAGLPVVTTRFAGIPEMIRDGENGILCSPGSWVEVADSVQKLIDDLQLRMKMGRAGRAHIFREYDPKKQFGGLINRLIDLGRHGGE